MGTRGATQEELEFDLRVIRLPIQVPQEGQVTRLRDPPHALMVGFEAADEEYHRILDTIDPKYYHELAVPPHFPVDKELAERLRSVLELQDSFPGVFGPGMVIHDDKVYKVWIQTYPCG